MKTSNIESCNKEVEGTASTELLPFVRLNSLNILKGATEVFKSLQHMPFLQPANITSHTVCFINKYIHNFKCDMIGLQLLKQTHYSN